MRGRTWRSTACRLTASPLSVIRTPWITRADIGLGFARLPTGVVFFTLTLQAATFDPLRLAVQLTVNLAKDGVTAVPPRACSATTAAPPSGEPPYCRSRIAELPAQSVTRARTSYEPRSFQTS